MSACQNCGNPIVVRYTRDEKKIFCTKECYDLYRRKGKSIKINLGSKYICLHCQKEFHPTRNTKGMYCSYACSNGSKSVRHGLQCKCCGRDFEINNIAEIKRGHYQYCSNECRKRKYRINEDFFNEINNKTAYWLGFIWSTLHDCKYNKISLLSTKENLERFNEAFNSNYPIKGTNLENNKKTLKITSLRLLDKLVQLGLKEVIYLEFPDIPSFYHKDFIRGYFDSDNGFVYKDNGSNIVTIHGRSSKVVRSISSFMEGKLTVNNGEWAFVTLDYKKIDGDPRLESKWIKFE